MKQFVIDELTDKEFADFKKYFASKFKKSPVGDLFFLPLDPEVLSDAQKAHKDCGPHYVSVECDDNKVVVELLVRSPQQIRCACMGFATEGQTVWIIRYLDAIMDYLGISA